MRPMQRRVPGSSRSIPSTAQVTVIGQFNAGNTGGKPATMTDLAFDSAGNLFGLGSVGGAHIYSINLTLGQATLVGSSGLSFTSGGGLEFGPVGYFIRHANRWPIRNLRHDDGCVFEYCESHEARRWQRMPRSPTTATRSMVSTLDQVRIWQTHLVTINPATGAVTDIAASVTALDAIAVMLAPPPVIGDYNANNVVDGADYVVWRDTFGQSAAGLPADGDPDGTIDDDDYGVWRSHFGNTTNPASAAAVPEPSSIAIAWCCACLLLMRTEKARKLNSARKTWRRFNVVRSTVVVAITGYHPRPPPGSGNVESSAGEPRRGVYNCDFTGYAG